MTSQELKQLPHSELIKLIDEGKLIYLPCKIGDFVYFDTYINNARTSIGVKPHEIRDIKVIYCADGADIPEWEIGKTIFLTLEEAEKALKERGVWKKEI